MSDFDPEFDELPVVKFLKSARYWVYVALAAVVAARAIWCIVYH